MRQRKRVPSHPGRIIKEHYLEPLALTNTALAKILDVSRKTVSKLVNERGAVNTEMALRLARAFSTSPDLWLNLQRNYDLWHAERSSQKWRKVKPVPGLESGSGKGLQNARALR